MIYITAIGIFVISYLLGSLNGSIILSAIKGEDIREFGSGNAGATNMLRIYGKKFAALTFLFDIIKGVVAVLIALWVVKLIENNTNSFFNMSNVDTNAKILLATSLKYIAGFGAVVGHNFPLYFGFKGGKGIATGAAVIITIEPLIGTAVTVLCIVVMAMTKYVSLGSILSGPFYIVFIIIKAVVTKVFNPIYLLFAVILAVMITTKHIPNIKRLLNGTESKIGQKKDKDSH